jgi:hypothetical protein
VKSYFGQIELSPVTDFAVLSSGESLPALIDVDDPSLVSTTGELAAALEGVGLRFSDVITTDIAPTPGARDSAPTYEFEIDDTLKIDDYLYRIAPFPMVDTGFASLCGILNWRNDESKLEIRSEEDVVYDGQPAMLRPLSPSVAYVSPGQTVSFLVSLDRPAPVGGLTIVLTLEPPSAGTLPDSVVLDPAEYEQAVDYVDGGAAADAVITASVNGYSSTLTVSEALSGQTHLVINEIDYDCDGAENAEFVEVFNPTSSAVSLIGKTILFFNGNGNVQYGSVGLDSAVSIPSLGYLLIASNSITAPDGVPVVRIPDNTIQNGSPDGLALVDATTGQVHDALAYEGAMPEITTQLGGGSVTITLTEGTATTAVDGGTGSKSLIRDPNGQDTDDASVDWKSTSTLTPGTANIYKP